MQFGPRALMSKMAFLPSGVTAGRDKANAKGQDDRWAGLARGVLEHGRQGGGVLARVGSEGAAVAGGASAGSPLFADLPQMCPLPCRDLGKGLLTCPPGDVLSSFPRASDFGGQGDTHTSPRAALIFSHSVSNRKLAGEPPSKQMNWSLGHQSP